MSSSLLRLGPAFVVLLAGLVAAGALMFRLGRLRPPRTVVTAVVRAVVQLAAVAGILLAAGSWPGIGAAFVAVMVGTAAWTAATRVARGPVPGTDGARGRPTARVALWLVLPVAVAPLAVVGVMLAAGILPGRALAVVPVAGILVGGAMTATSLAGRRAFDELGGHWDVYESALALGVDPRVSRLLVIRAPAADAMLPALDQTRTVGLVTLPGAFIGMLLGGASPVAAGAVQLFVLIALLAVEAVAVVVTTRLVASGRVRRPAPGAAAAPGPGRPPRRHAPLAAAPPAPGAGR